MIAAGTTLTCDRAARVACLVMALLIAGCSGIGSGSRRNLSPRAAETAHGSDEFIVAANVLDTWNTVGQVLVRLDDVTYEGRAQMLGIYAVRYRGERFLIHTQALVMHDPSDGLRTRVEALAAGGGHLRSEAAMALLGVLQQRVPLEVGRYHMPIKTRP